MSTELHRRLAASTGMKYSASLDRTDLEQEKAILEYENRIIERLDGMLQSGEIDWIPEKRSMWGSNLDVMTMRSVLARVKHTHLVKIASIENDERMQ
jgi:hypothetical protein